MSVTMWWSFLSPRFVFTLFVIKEFATELGLMETIWECPSGFYFSVGEVDGDSGDHGNDDSNKS